MVRSFFNFLQGSLIPNMMPFDGQNGNSILVMDNLNCSVHHVHEVVDLIRQSGILLLFLPPYSPDLNPAEEAFSHIKRYLKKHDTYCNVESALLMLSKLDFIITHITQCQSWTRIIITLYQQNEYKYANTNVINCTCTLYVLIIMSFFNCLISSQDLVTYPLRLCPLVLRTAP